MSEIPKVYLCVDRLLILHNFNFTIVVDDSDFYLCGNFDDSSLYIHKAPQVTSAKQLRSFVRLEGKKRMRSFLGAQTIFGFFFKFENNQLYLE